jgi:hypothetical protein
MIAAIAVAFALTAPIRHVGDTFQVSFQSPSARARLQVLSGADVVNGPNRTNTGWTWIIRATGGPCEVAAHFEEPFDVVFEEFPVSLDKKNSDGFVHTTFGLGYGSSAPMLVVVGNGWGAPSHQFRFAPTYEYVTPGYSHYAGELGGIWRAHLIVEDGFVELWLTNLYDTTIEEINLFGSARQLPKSTARGTTYKIRAYLP